MQLLLLHSFYYCTVITIAFRPSVQPVWAAGVQPVPPPRKPGAARTAAAHTLPSMHLWGNRCEMVLARQTAVDATGNAKPLLSRVLCMYRWRLRPAARSHRPRSSPPPHPTPSKRRERSRRVRPSSVRLLFVPLFVRFFGFCRTFCPGAGAEFVQPIEECVRRAHLRELCEVLPPPRCILPALPSAPPITSS